MAWLFPKSVTRNMKPVQAPLSLLRVSSARDRDGVEGEFVVSRRNDCVLPVNFVGERELALRRSWAEARLGEKFSAVNASRLA